MWKRMYGTVALGCLMGYLVICSNGDTRSLEPVRYDCDESRLVFNLNTGKESTYNTDTLNQMALCNYSVVNISTVRYLEQKISTNASKEVERKEQLEKEKAEREAIEREDYVLSHICQNVGVNQYWVDEVNKTACDVPREVRKAFVELEWGMYCTYENLDNKFFGGTLGPVMGVTDLATKSIYFEDRADAVVEAPVHEFGHFIDFSQGVLTNSSEYMSIYYSETAVFRESFPAIYYYDNRELFAEGFEKYVYEPEKLNMYCPQLYAYIEDALKLFEKYK